MKKIAIALTLALVVALAAPAMAADLDINGLIGVENGYTNPETSKSTSNTGGYLELYLDAEINDQVTAYSEIDFGYDFNKDTNADTTTSVYEMWVNVEDAFGPVDLKAGRMFEAAAGSMLYEFDSDEFARLAYESGNVAAKLGHSIDSNGKVVFFEGAATDLGLVDGVTLNYIEDNADEYDGYTLRVNKTHSFVDAALTFGDVDNGTDSANVIDLSMSTDVLLPGVTTSLEYADAEAGFVRDKANTQDSALNDADSVVADNDFEMIKPGVSFGVTDKLNVSASYAMYDADTVDAENDYLDIVGTYDLAENTILEVEYEDYTYDGTAAGQDKEVITTTLETSF
ncbi:porin family protein [Selenihalanaerobacter shriftii]|uniref:Porin n=1 Tax=Selenihalanaerobacter shriftii TaxID=142842 RepID=A0A1T4JJF2_9FIRM|nr:hypothetical protein [Selenihalanaerobacter shriftii]SJZ30263.1 hypothetical protein SAMN02745118_00022 [Selenihalanaerobacter shriftii]